MDPNLNPNPRARTRTRTQALTQAGGKPAQPRKLKGSAFLRD